MKSTTSPGPIRFGVFEVDLRAGELRKQGVKIKLQEQPFQILLLLLERPGEVITREELREKLWSDDTFVDFEHSLSTAIGKIRDALGDSAENPRFVETVSRRGYRFLTPLLRAEEEQRLRSGLGSPGGAAIAPGVRKLDLKQKLSTAEISVGSETDHAVKAPEAIRKRRLVGLILAVLLLPAMLALAAFIHFRRSSTDAGVIRLSLVVPEEATFEQQGGPLVSPDGRRVAFAAATSGKSFLWVRPLDAPTAQKLSGTEGARQPFWSPDSRWIGFFAQGKLKSIDVYGGAPQTVCDVVSNSGGTWNRDGVTVFSSGLELYRVSATGGKSMLLTTLDRSRQELAHQWPHFLPDGRHFLYVLQRAQPDNLSVFSIQVGSLNSKETKRLLSANSSALYAPPGYLLFIREGTLRAQPFAPKELMLTGDEFVVTHDVACDVYNPRGSFSVSETGLLAYWTGGDRQLAWVDRAGKRVSVPGPPDLYGTPRLSPDEKSAAVTRSDFKMGPSDIWVVDLWKGMPSRFTYDSALDGFPVWSPDGSRIVFTSLRDGSWNLFQKPASGAGTDAMLLKSSDHKFPSDWSLDGRFITYMSLSRTAMDLWVLPLFGDVKPRPFLQTEFNERNGQFSPDLRWMAYDSDESGKTEVYVRPFPSSGGKRRVSTDGGSDPKWRRDGKELFYVAPDWKLMAVSVKGGASFEAGTPVPLFETHFDKPYLCGEYAVTRDGQRFLMPIGRATSVPFTVVMNWTAGLKH